MATVQQVLVKVNGDTKGLSAAAKTAKSDVDNLGESGKSAAGSAESGFSKAKVAVLGFTVAAAAGLAKLGSQIDEQSGALKSFRANMALAGQSTDATNKTLEDLTSFANKTIYSLTDMTTTAGILAASGVKDSTALSKSFGVLAASASDPQQAMKTLSQQATQMAAKPIVAWQDFKLVVEQTPGGMATVANSMGMSLAQLTTAVQSGKVSTEQFFDAVNKAGQNPTLMTLATQPQTISSAWDTFTSTIISNLTSSKQWETVQSSIITGLGSFGSMVETTVIPAVMGMVDWLVQASQSPFVQFVKTTLTTAMTGAQSVFNSFSTVAAGVWSWLNQLPTSPLGGFISTTLIAAMNTAGSVFQDFQSIAASIVDVVTQIVDSPLGGFIQDVLITAFNTAGGIIGGISDMFSTFSDNLNTFTPLLSALGVVLVATMIPAIVGVVAGIWSTVSAIAAQTIALLASPITWVVLAIAAIVAAIVALAMNWDSVSSAIMSALNAVGDFFKSVWDGIVGVWNAVTTWFGGIFTKAKDGIVNAWNSVVGWFKGIWDSITGVFSAVGTWFSDKFSAAVDAIKKVFGAIGDWFQGIWDGITSGLSAFGDAIKGGFESAFNAVVGAVKTVINGVISAINGAIWVINLIPGVDIPEIKKLATGGWVSGEGGRTQDRVPAMLSPTEYVINSRAAATVEETYGSGSMDYLNKYGKLPTLGGGNVTKTANMTYNSYGDQNPDAMAAKLGYMLQSQ